MVTYQRSAVSLMCVLGACAGSASAAFSLEAPGYRLFNRVAVPAALPDYVGDMRFSDDGSTAIFIGGSEEDDAGVWRSTVVRDMDGNVTAFSAATPLFTSAYADTGLESMPGSATTLFRGVNPSTDAYSIVQRLGDGTFEYTDIPDTSYDATYGGLAIVPNGFTSAGQILSSSYDDSVIHAHGIADDGDDSFTISSSSTLVMEPGTAIGDMEYILDGPLTNSLLMDDFDNDAVLYTPIDPVTGLPSSNTTNVFAYCSSAWGLAVDPVTGNIWLNQWTARNTPMFQITVPAPGVTSVAGLLALGVVRRTRRTR